MKMVACRSTDIRDIFLMISEIKDKTFIKNEVSERASFQDRLEKIGKEITSKQFKDGLQGVFGFILKLGLIPRALGTASNFKRLKLPD